MPILVVEDDPSLRDLLSFVLTRDGYEVLTAVDGTHALVCWQEQRPDLMLLDVSLPVIDGWEVCRTIRRESRTPVILLTGQTSDADIVRGLDLGADDCITKPFSPRQLLARVRAVLRRAEEAAPAEVTPERDLVAGDLRLSAQWRTVQRNDETIQLTPTEFKLLLELASHAGQVVPRAALVDRVWGYEGVDDGSLLKSHIRNLRREIDPPGGPGSYIRTVSGPGYAFTPREPVAC
jgi:DNA-binding response OmpR family regulator